MEIGNDGTWYLNWGSYGYGIYGIEMENPPLKAKSGAKPVMMLVDVKWPMARDNPNRTEGPFVYNRGDYYYLFYRCV